MAKKQPGLERAEIFSIGEVLDECPLPLPGSRARVKKSKTKLGEHEVKLGGRQYVRVFKLKGTSCVYCGLEGTFFAVERHCKKSGRPCGGWHLNLYAVDSEGDEVLMTKDHIIPKAKGGGNSLSNLQPMCCECNTIKDDNLE